MDEACSILSVSSSFSFLLVCIYVSLGSAPYPNGHEKRKNSRRMRLRFIRSALPKVEGTSGPAPDPKGCEKRTNIRRVRLCLLCSPRGTFGSTPDPKGCEKTTNIRRVCLCFIRSNVIYRGYGGSAPMEDTKRMHLFVYQRSFQT